MLALRTVITLEGVGESKSAHSKTSFDIQSGWALHQVGLENSTWQAKLQLPGTLSEGFSRYKVREVKIFTRLNPSRGNQVALVKAEFRKGSFHSVKLNGKPVAYKFVTPDQGQEAASGYLMLEPSNTEIHEQVGKLFNFDVEFHTVIQERQLPNNNLRVLYEGPVNIFEFTV